MNRVASRGARLRVAALAVGGTLLLWQLTSTFVFRSILFPSVTDTAAAMTQLILGPDLRGHALSTMGRVLAGFAIGSAAGIVLGLLAGSVGPVRRFVEPYINFFRFVTPIAWIAPATIWFGVGETTRLFLVVYATIFIVAVNTIAAIAHIDRNKVRMARAFGAGRVDVFRLITIPVSIPFILVGMRIGMGNSFMTVIGAEMLAGQDGLGYLLYSSRVFFRSDIMFATIVVLGILGFLTDRAFGVLQRTAFGRYEGRG